MTLGGRSVVLAPVTAKQDVDGSGWHDGLLMDLLAEELDRSG